MSHYHKILTVKENGDDVGERGIFFASDNGVDIFSSVSRMRFAVWLVTSTSLRFDGRILTCLLTGRWTCMRKKSNIDKLYLKNVFYL